MWNPPIALTLEEQKIAARTRKARKFFVFLRERRHELLDATFQDTLAETYRAEPGGKKPVEAGLLALTTLLQAYCHVGDRDAVELTVMDKRWQMVLDCLGAEQPPFSQGTLWNFRMRLMVHNLDKILLERTVTLAEQSGGFGARQLRAALDSTPLFGAGRVEDTLNLLGHALRKAVGLAARALDASAEAMREEAGLVLVGHSSLKAALDRDWGQPKAREQALRLVLDEVDRWTTWLEQHQRLVEEDLPCRTSWTRSPRLSRRTPNPTRTVALGARASRSMWPRIGASPLRMRACGTGVRAAPKRQRLSGTLRLDLESHVTREVVVRPANEPEHAAVELLVETLSSRQGCSSLISTWGTWPVHALRNGPSRAFTSLPAPGRKAGRSSPRTTSPWTLRTGPSPVRGARPSRWSRAKTPGFPPAPVMGVHSERSAPQLGSVKGETCISGRTNRSSTSSVPRSKPSADVPRCANAPRWSMRYPITSRIKDGVPAIRGYARTSLMAAAMRRSVTSKWRPIMKRNYSSLPEV